MVTAKVAILRHGEKQKTLLNGRKAVPGSLEDLNDIHLTERGVTSLSAQGSDYLHQQQFDNVVSMFTPHIRTRESTEAYIGSKNFRISEKLVTSNLGVILGVDYDDKDAIAAYIKSGEHGLVEFYMKHHFVRNNEPGQLCMAQVTSYFVHELARGIRMLMQGQRQGKAQGLLSLVSHMTNVDTFANLGAKYARVEDGEFIFDNARYDEVGNVKMGTVFNGEVLNLESDNPSLEVRSNGLAVGAKLSDLDRIAAEHAGYAALKA